MKNGMSHTTCLAFCSSRRASNDNPKIFISLGWCDVRVWSGVLLFSSFYLNWFFFFSFASFCLFPFPF